MSEASNGVGPEPTHMSGPAPATDEQIRASFVGELTPYAVEVVVEDYDPEWPAWYREEESKIRSALGERVGRIEHTGSTSVPGLAAKPIIDITPAGRRQLRRELVRPGLGGDRLPASGQGA